MRGPSDRAASGRLSWANPKHTSTLTAASRGRVDLAGQRVDGDVELAPVPVLERSAQVADMNLAGGAVEQNVDRLTACG